MGWWEKKKEAEQQEKRRKQWVERSTIAAIFAGAALWHYGGDVPPANQNEQGQNTQIEAGETAQVPAPSKDYYGYYPPSMIKDAPVVTNAPVTQEAFHQSIADNLRNDPEGFLLLPYETRHDRAFVLEALEDNSRFFPLIPSELKEDVSFLKEALGVNHHVAQYFDLDDVISSKEDAIQLVEQNPSLYARLSSEMRHDKDIALAMLANGRSYYIDYLPETLRVDTEFMAEAISVNPSFVLFSETAPIITDAETLSSMLENRGSSLRLASDELKADRTLVLQAVNQDGRALRYASEDLRNDREIVEAAILNDGNAILFASEALQSDTELVMKALENMRFLSASRFADTPLYENREVMMHIVERAPFAFSRDEVNPFADDKEFMLHAISHYPRYLRDASERLKADPEVLLATVRANLAKRGDYEYRFSEEELKTLSDYVDEKRSITVQPFQIPSPRY